MNKTELYAAIVILLIALAIVVFIPPSYNAEHLYEYLDHYDSGDIKDYLGETYGSIRQVYGTEEIIQDYRENLNFSELFNEVIDEAIGDGLFDEYIRHEWYERIKEIAFEDGWFESWAEEELPDTDLAYEEGYADAKRDFDEWLHSNEGFYEVLSAALYDFWDNIPPPEGSPEYELWSVIRDIYNDYR